MFFTDLATLNEWRQMVGRCTVVATNGCFDLLHVGHLEALRAAKRCGDVLVVGLNDDAGVRALKGPHRPVMSQEQRALLVHELKCVDHVVIFKGTTATEFLAACQPTVWVKGGDYTLDTLNRDERDAVERNGGFAKILPRIGEESTTKVLERL